MKPAIVFLSALLLLPVVAALAPSEILYDPTGNDNGLEFIELVGDENLTLCTVRDASSADALELLRADDGGTILIVESDGAYANLTGATVYGVGAAIGNGLGNTAETITISCDDTVLLSIAYNTSLLPEIPDGASIVWRDAWVAGAVGGTPGVLDEAPAEPSAPTAEEPTPSAPSIEEACNTTLFVTVSATQGEPGDTVAFTIVSPEYASWEALTDDGLLAYGDTVTSRTHAITLPHAREVRLIAESRACGGRQRATRHIAIAPVENESAVALVAVAAPAPPEPAPVIEPAVTALVKEPDETITPRVVVDEDRDAVPWIAAFGIVTVLASAAVFVVVHKREADEKRTYRVDGRMGGDGEAKYLRTRWARQRHDSSDGQASEGAPQEGVGPGRRDV